MENKISTPLQSGTSTATSYFTGSAALEEESKVLEDYVIGQRLGEGAYGSVYAVTYVPSGEMFALKILQKEDLFMFSGDGTNGYSDECPLNLESVGSPLGNGSASGDYFLDYEILRMKAFSEQLERHIVLEATVLQALGHRHVVKFYKFLSSLTAFYFVMELAEGGELFDLILSKNHFSEDEARHYFQQLISAIDYCHRNGVAHKDLKAENLLLGSDNRLLVCDFGFSTKVAKENIDELGGGTTVGGESSHEGPDIEGCTFGTLHYMSPEAVLASTQSNCIDRSFLDGSFGLGATHTTTTTTGGGGGSTTFVGSPLIMTASGTCQSIAMSQYSGSTSQKRTAATANDYGLVAVHNNREFRHHYRDYDDDKEEEESRNCSGSSCAVPVGMTATLEDRHGAQSLPPPEHTTMATAATCSFDAPLPPMVKRSTTTMGASFARGKNTSSNHAPSDTLYSSSGGGSMRAPKRGSCQDLSVHDDVLRTAVLAGSDDRNNNNIHISGSDGSGISGMRTSHSTGGLDALLKRESSWHAVHGKGGKSSKAGTAAAASPLTNASITSKASNESSGGIKSGFNALVRSFIGYSKSSTRAESGTRGTENHGPPFTPACAGAKGHDEYVSEHSARSRGVASGNVNGRNNGSFRQKHIPLHRHDSSSTATNTTTKSIHKEKKTKGSGKEKNKNTLATIANTNRYEVPDLSFSNAVASPNQRQQRKRKGATIVDAFQQDLWSAGVILFFMLTGRLPFDGRDDEETQYLIQSNTFSFQDDELTTISSEARDLVTSMLALDPTDRPTLDQIIESKWFAKDIRLAEDFPHRPDLGEKLIAAGVMEPGWPAFLDFSSAHPVTEKEEQAISTAFRKIDSDGYGKITRDQVRDMLTTLHGEAVPKNEVSELVNLFTGSPMSTEITFRQFRDAWVSKDLAHISFAHSNEFQLANIIGTQMDEVERQVVRQLRTAFDSVDDDHTGVIGLCQLRRVFEKMHIDVQDGDLVSLINYFQERGMTIKGSSMTSAGCTDYSFGHGAPVAGGTPLTAASPTTTASSATTSPTTVLSKKSNSSIILSTILNNANNPNRHSCGVSFDAFVIGIVQRDILLRHPLGRRLAAATNLAALFQSRNVTECVRHGFLVIGLQNVILAKLASVRHRLLLLYSDEVVSNTENIYSFRYLGSTALLKGENMTTVSPMLASTSVGPLGSSSNAAVVSLAASAGSDSGGGAVFGLPEQQHKQQRRCMTMGTIPRLHERRSMSIAMANANASVTGGNYTVFVNTNTFGEACGADRGCNGSEKIGGAAKSNAGSLPNNPAPSIGDFVQGGPAVVAAGVCWGKEEKSTAATNAKRRNSTKKTPTPPPSSSSSPNRKHPLQAVANGSAPVAVAATGTASTFKTITAAAAAASNAKNIGINNSSSNGSHPPVDHRDPLCNQTPRLADTTSPSSTFKSHSSHVATSISVNEKCAYSGSSGEDTEDGQSQFSSSRRSNSIVATGECTPLSTYLEDCIVKSAACGGKRVVVATGAATATGRSTKKTHSPAAEKAPVSTTNGTKPFQGSDKQDAEGTCQVKVQSLKRSTLTAATTSGSKKVPTPSSTAAAAIPTTMPTTTAAGAAHAQSSTKTKGKKEKRLAAAHSCATTGTPPPPTSSSCAAVAISSTKAAALTTTTEITTMSNGVLSAPSTVLASTWQGTSKTPTRGAMHGLNRASLSHRTLAYGGSGAVGQVSGVCDVDVILAPACLGYILVKFRRIHGKTSDFHEAVTFISNLLDVERQQAMEDMMPRGESELM